MMRQPRNMGQPNKIRLQNKVRLAHKMGCDSFKRGEEASLKYEAASLEVDSSPDAAVSQDEDVSVLRLPQRVCLPPKMWLL